MKQRAVLRERLRAGLVALMATVMLSVAPVHAEDVATPVANADTLLDEVMTVEAIETQILELNRDLFMLEEDVLFPPNTQVVVFVSWQGAAYFNLDSIELKIDDDVVSAHLYTERQKTALKSGGLQRLYLGNLKAGAHEVTAVLTGLGPEARAYRRATSLTVEKTTEPLRLALEIRDDPKKQQPHFTLSRWGGE